MKEKVVGVIVWIVVVLVVSLGIYSLLKGL